MTTENMYKLGEAYDFALEAHGHQTYGKRPYFYHLKKTADIAAELGFNDNVIIACVLHDTLEDTPLSYNDVRKKFGERIADIVYAVTDELGKNRKERKERTMPKIVADEDAISVKLCDRIANVENALLEKHDMLGMYQKEHASFMENFTEAILTNPKIRKAAMRLELMIIKFEDIPV